MNFPLILEFAYSLTLGFVHSLTLGFAYSLTLGIAPPPPLCTPGGWVPWVGCPLDSAGVHAPTHKGTAGEKLDSCWSPPLPAGPLLSLIGFPLGFKGLLGVGL